MVIGHTDRGIISEQDLSNVRLIVRSSVFIADTHDAQQVQIVVALYTSSSSSSLSSSLSSLSLSSWSAAAAAAAAAGQALQHHKTILY